MQAKPRNISVLEFGAPYIRDFMVYVIFFLNHSYETDIQNGKNNNETNLNTVFTVSNAFYIFIKKLQMNQNSNIQDINW